MGQCILLVGSSATQFYCLDVQNVGVRPPDAFQLTVHADGTLFRTLPVATLPAGQTDKGNNERQAIVKCGDD